MRDRFRVPSAARIRLGPARRFYITKLLGTGLHGDSPAEVVERIFSVGLERSVQPEWAQQVPRTRDGRRRRGIRA